MDIREKLVELMDFPIINTDRYGTSTGEYYIPEHVRNKIADHLIANNVTVQEWIPVTERLPDGECLAVSMLKYQPAYDEMLVGYVAKNDFYETGYYCESDGEILPNVTHWSEKPTPPKGE